MTKYQPVKTRGLTLKRKKFVSYIALGKSSAEAYKLAGFSCCRGYEVHASNLLKDAKVAVAIEEAHKIQKEIVEVDQQWVLEKLKKMVERSLQEVALLDKTGKPSGVWKYDSFGAGKALELLGKYLRMFGDGAEAQAAVNNILQIIMTLLQQAPPDYREFAIGELRKYQAGSEQQVRSGRA